MKRDESVLRVIGWPAFRNRLFNSYNALLYEALAEAGVRVSEFSTREVLFGRYDVLHLHWPEKPLRLAGRFRPALRVCQAILLAWVARLRGADVVWTVHNLEPHERRHRVLWRLGWPMLRAAFTGWISLSRTLADRLAQVHPDVHRLPGALIRHGHYRTVAEGSAGDRIGSHSARTEPPLVLFFGQLRPYKNVGSLIRAFRKSDGAWNLVVAGLPGSDELKRGLEGLAGDDPRIRFQYELLPEGELADLVRSSTLVVLPYERDLNSGSILYALSCGRPVLVPNHPSLVEIASFAGREWVMTYEPPLDAATLDAAMGSATRLSGHPDLSAFEWDAIARDTLAFFLRLRAGR
jgi:beta-1,4-mannosyltransferase